MASGWALAFSAIMMLSLLLFWDLIAAACLLTIITRFSVYRMIPAAWSMLSLIGLNSILFLPKKKYLQVEAMFENEEKAIRNRRRFWCLVYIVLSGISVPLLYYILGEVGLWYYYPKRLLYR